MKYVVQIPSATYTGQWCYLVAPQSLGRDTTPSDPWRRALVVATGFDTPEEAARARDQMIAARIYEAPEVNDNLNSRMLSARIVTAEEAGVNLV